MILKKHHEFPIRTYQKLEADAMNALLSALGRLNTETSATIQVLLKPEDDDWQEKIKKMIRKAEKNPGKRIYISYNPLVWIRALLETFIRDPEDIKKDEPQMEEKEPIDDEGLMKEKVKKT